MVAWCFESGWPFSAIVNCGSSARKACLHRSLGRDSTGKRAELNGVLDAGCMSAKRCRVIERQPHSVTYLGISPRSPFPQDQSPDSIACF